MDLRPATEADWPGIWDALAPVIRAGETYALPPDMSEADARAYWCAADKEVFVAEVHGAIAGTYVLRANQSGPGSHVANAGYIVHPDHAGRGVARALCTHSLATARERGYRAMQFNFVVSSNVRAVRLWQHMGFAIVGTLPGAFRRPVLGFVDVHVMYQSLTGE